MSGQHNEAIRPKLFIVIATNVQRRETLERSARGEAHTQASFVPDKEVQP